MSEVRSPQIVEATHTQDRIRPGVYHPGPIRLTLYRTSPEAVGAGEAGATAGENVIGAAVAKGVSDTLKRAAELLTVRRAAGAKKKELAEKLTVLKREQTAAPLTLFGAALTARLADLESEIRATGDLIWSADQERDEASRELKRLRDVTVKEAPAALRKAIAARRTVLGIEREKVASALIAAVAKHLAALLRLDSELEVLSDLEPVRVIEDVLVEALPDVFGGDGLAPWPVEYELERERPEPLVPLRLQRDGEGWQPPLGKEGDYE